LARLCAGLTGRVAVDTEFHAERRHEPDLYLVQVHQAGEPTALIDPRALQDLAPLGQALSDCQVLVHGGERDLQLLVRHAGLDPRHVTDTQVLAGCTGLGFPRRLEDLRAELLDAPAPEHRTGLSDWRRRPLGPDQLAYAAADVRQLPELADRLLARAAPARLALAQGATRELVDRWLTPPVPSDLWRRLPAARVLDHRERQRLRHLTAWRHGQAQARNLSPWNVASDRVLVDVARRAPRTVASLGANRLMPKGLLKRSGEELVRLVHEAPDVPLRPLASTPPARAFQAALQAWAHGLEARSGVASGLVMPPWRLDLLVADWVQGQPCENVPAWLEEFSGEELRMWTAGQATLRVTRSAGLAPDY